MGAAGSLRAAGDAAGRTATSVRRRVSLPILDSYAVTERLLAGEYPGAADAEIAERRMRAFAERGVATFVDLTHRRIRLRPTSTSCLPRGGGSRTRSSISGRPRSPI